MLSAQTAKLVSIPFELFHHKRIQKFYLEFPFFPSPFFFFASLENRVSRAAIVYPHSPMGQIEIFRGNTSESVVH